MGSALIIVFTGIIAAATVAYVIVNVFLWRATKRSADAAKVSADAAKKSADISAALQRPYLGVSLLQRRNDYKEDMWTIRCCVKNYGTLPAAGVKTLVVVHRQEGSYGEGPLYSGCEILPQAELEGFLQIRVDADTRAMLSKTDWPMIASVEIKYLAPGGARYTHNAKFAYDRATLNFRPETSETIADAD
jgi:hypothetical protein